MLFCVCFIEEEGISRLKKEEREERGEESLAAKFFHYVFLFLRFVAFVARERERES